MSSPFPLVPLSEILEQDLDFIDAPEPREYKKLSVKLYGKGVSLDVPADGTLLRMPRHQLAKAGQVILSEIWGKRGAIGIVPPEGEGALCTSHFFLFNVRKDRVQPAWLKAIFEANYLEEQLNAGAHGTTGYAAVRPAHLLAAKIPLPDPPEQKRIVARIEALAGRIEEARSLREFIRRLYRAALLSRFQRLTLEARWEPISLVAPLRRRPITVEPDVEYHELGIRSFGNGTFHKAGITGFELGDKKMFQIEPGDLIFNVVFAWEGAVAVASHEDRGRVGSHRFLTCVPTPGLATSEFLRFYFLSPHGLDQLGRASPGGAGRNRTLSISALSALRVPIIDYRAQLSFDEIQHKFSEIGEISIQSDRQAETLTGAALAKAFAGEL